MTTVTAKFSRPEASGTDVPASGHVLARLWVAESVDGVIRSTESFRADLDAEGSVSLQLSPTAASQAWSLRVVGVPGVRDRWVVVPASPSSVAWEDLVEVNPDTLVVTEDLRDAMEAALAAARELLANVLTKSANLSDVTSPSAARANLGAAAASHQHAQSDVTGLTSALAAKADLVDGVVPTSQIPARALVNAIPVADQAAMLALTSAQVQPGDVAIRADGGGTWMLTDPDPSTLGSWVLMAPPTSEVTSVNGQVGTVVLGASDVGAATPAEVASAVDAVEVLAAGYAASAQGSADSASSSATAAATSAGQASTAKTAAETARDQAVTAKTDAQTAAAAVPSWWAGTQTAYNALGTYDPNRLYVITGA